MRIADYIEQNSISMEITGGPEYDIEMHDGKEWPHHVWEVLLTNGEGTEMTVNWKTGIGITADPKVEEVFDNLLSTASGYWSDTSFEGWCGEYGYDTDSIRILRLYEAVKAEAEEFKAFVGGWSEVEYIARYYDRL